MARYFRKTVLLVSLATLLGACEGASNHFETIDGGQNSKHAHTEDLCSVEEGWVTCDVSRCDEDCTVLVIVNGQPVEAVGSCPAPDQEPKVDFKNRYPEGFDVVCQSGDEDPILLAHGLGLKKESTVIEGTTSGDIITPSNPGGTSGAGTADGGSSTGGSSGGGTSGDAPKDSDGDGVLDDADQCPGTPTGEKVQENGCQKISIVIKPELFGSAFADPEKFLNLKQDFQTYFGKFDLNWNIPGNSEEIQELYLWSFDFNRDLQDADSCVKSVTGFLIVDPATGQNYNPGSPNADAVKDLMEGKSCNNSDGDLSNDCDGMPQKFSAACRIDLKKGGQWLTKGSLSTIGSGVDSSGRFVLVAKLKNGQILKSDKALAIPAAELTSTSVTYAERDGKPMINARFHYRNVDPRTKVAATSNNSPCVTSVKVSADGSGDYDGLCSLKPSNEIVLVARGLSYTSSVSYHLNFGAPTATIKSTAPSTIYGPAKYDFFYSISRPWTLTSSDAGVSLSGNLQSSKVVGQIHLMRMNPAFLADAKNNPLLVEVAAQAAGASDRFAGIDVNHDAFEFHLTVDEMDGSKTFDNLAQMQVHFSPVHSVTSLGNKACGVKLETDPYSDWGCGDDCPLHPFVASYDADYIVQLRDIRKFDVQCKGAAATIKPMPVPSITDPKSYETQTYTVHIGTGPISGQFKSHAVNCTFKVTQYDGQTASDSFGDTCAVGEN